MKRKLLLFMAVAGFAHYGQSQCVPVISGCPTDVVVAMPSQCDTIINYTPPTFTGCNGVMMQTEGLASGATFPQGLTTNTYEVFEKVSVFAEDFSDNSAGWTLGTEWAIGTAMPSTCGGNSDPSADNSPTADNGVAGVVLGGCASVVIHPYYYLTSPVINTAGMANLELEFYRWLNSDYTPYMQNIIEVYDGTAWQMIWQTGISPGVEDIAWNLQNYDISAYANTNMQVRFGFLVGNTGAFNRGSWNLDDVSINNLLATGASCSFIVDYPDQAPVVSGCIADTTINVTAGTNCEAVFVYTAPIGTDCTPITTTMLEGLPSGSAFPVGVTPVTYEFKNTQTIYFEDDFSDTLGGWTLGNEWEIGSAIISACPQGADPGMDNTATSDNGIAGVVIGGCASTAVHPFSYLTSPVIDLSGATGTIELQFYRWLTSDFTPYMQNTIDVWDGTAWVNIWITGSSPGVVDNSWNYQNYDISAYLNANFQFRFGFNVNSTGAFTIGQWNVDDVKVVTPAGLTSTCSFNVTVANDLAQTQALVQPTCSSGLGSIAVSTTGGLSPITIDSMGYDFSALPAGMMYYNVTDAAGCEVMDSAMITIPSAISATSTTFDPLCSDDFGTGIVNYSGGTGGTGILWNNTAGSTVTLVSDLLDGYTSYTITDGNGCTYVDSVLIVAPAPLLVPSTTVNICDGTASGTATVAPSGGVPSYTILWSNNSTSFTATGLNPGTYSYNVTDSNSCVVGGSAEVLSSAMVLSATTTDEIAGSDGAVDLTVSGGYSPYSFSWDNSATVEDLTGLTAGDYIVTVTDSIGCVSTDTYTVNSQVGLSENQLTKVEIYPNPNDGVFMIKLNDQKVDEVQIFDAQGRLVYKSTETLSELVKIELTNLERGTYLVKLVGERAAVVKQIIIN